MNSQMQVEVDVVKYFSVGVPENTDPATSLPSLSLNKCPIVNHVGIIWPIIAISYNAIEHIIKMSEVSYQKKSQKK